MTDVAPAIDQALEDLDARITEALSGKPIHLEYPFAPPSVVHQDWVDFRNGWHYLFGGKITPRPAPPPRPLTQKQINTKLADLLGQIEIQVMNTTTVVWTVANEALTASNRAAATAAGGAVNVALALYRLLQQQIGQALAQAYDHTNLTVERSAAHLGAEDQRLYNASVAHADSLYNRVERQIAQAVRTVTLRAEGLYNRAVADTTRRVRIIEGQMVRLRSQVDAEILHVRDLVDTGDTQTLHTSEQFTLQAVATATTGIIATVLTQVTPALQAIEKETAECLDPLCDTVTPNAKQLGNLGKLLKFLEGPGFDLALFGALAYAAADPVPAAEAVDVVFGTPVQDVAGGLVDLIRAL